MYSVMIVKDNNFNFRIVNTIFLHIFLTNRSFSIISIFLNFSLVFNYMTNFILANSKWMNSSNNIFFYTYDSNLNSNI